MAGMEDILGHTGNLKIRDKYVSIIFPNHIDS